MFKQASTTSKHCRTLLFSASACKGNRNYSVIPPSASSSAPHTGHTKKITVQALHKKYKDKVPLTMVTAYDSFTASLVDKAAIDMLLVGDSLSMVVLGHQNTTSVTMDEMIHHCKAVSNGCKHALIIGDMPFGSYEASERDAVNNAVRMIKEGQVNSVKVEGGRRILPQVQAMVKAGIHVIGHIGLTPQTAHGNYRLFGKTVEEALNIYRDAVALQEAGVYAMVLESVPQELATFITSKLHVPTIGIGSGSGTSGQVLVSNDMFGTSVGHVPKFAKQYRNIGAEMLAAFEEYKNEVVNNKFPSEAHAPKCGMKEYEKFVEEVNKM